MNKTCEAPAPLIGQAQLVRGPRIGEIVLWTNGSKPSGRPLLLVHSVNAAASAYEVKPLFDHYRTRRPTFALELPGFGHSERSKKTYTFALMTEAIVHAVEWIRKQTASAVDIIALSLSCEFVAAACSELHGAIRSLGLISPTGFETKSPVRLMRQPFAKSFMHAILDGPPWSRALYRAFMRKAVIRRFLEKTWGSAAIDESLLEYDRLLSRQPGAQHAPFSFIAGYLFTDAPLRLYDQLSVPVWVGHGTRGDFVDYSSLPAFIAARTGRQATTFNSGAFPHFEQLPALIEAYECAVAA